MKTTIFSKIIFLLTAFLMMPFEIQAAILWTGGEDVDFPNGAAVCTTTSAANFRAGYARMAITPCTNGQLIYSNQLPGGAVTSAWLSFRWHAYHGASANVYQIAGLVKYGTEKGLWVGHDATTGTKLALWKFDGTTATELAASSTSLIVYNAIHKIDMQVINYGASATVNIYIDGAASPAVTFSGDVTVAGITDLDAVGIRKYYSSDWYSEFIVSTTDTRSMSVATLAPNAAGTTNTWSGSYTDVSETAINDATVSSTTTAGNNFQCNLSNLPAGSFTVEGVKVVARGVKTGSGIGAMSVGLNVNGTVDAPASVNQLPAWMTNETYYSNNPITVAPWSMTDLNNLQINLQGN